jgi:hypothetical protein
MLQTFDRLVYQPALRQTAKWPGPATAGRFIAYAVPQAADVRARLTVFDLVSREKRVVLSTNDMDLVHPAHARNEPSTCTSRWRPHGGAPGLFLTALILPPSCVERNHSGWRESPIKPADSLPGACDADGGNAYIFRSGAAQQEVGLMAGRFVQCFVVAAILGGSSPRALTPLRNRTPFITAGTVVASSGPAEQAEIATERRFAFAHVNVVDVERGVVRDDQTVVVVGDRLAEVGPADRVTTPPGAPVIDVRGKFLIPGRPEGTVSARRRPTMVGRTGARGRPGG